MLLRLQPFFRGFLTPDSRRLTPSLFIASLGVAGLQVFLFAVIWTFLVQLAIVEGRPMRGGVAFGITIFYAGRMLCVGFLVATLVSALVSRHVTRCAVILGILVPWSLFLVPCLSSYPIRGTTFYLLGISLLLFGSGVVVPLLRKRLSPTGRISLPTSEHGTDAKSPQKRYSG